YTTLFRSAASLARAGVAQIKKGYGRFSETRATNQTRPRLAEDAPASVTQRTDAQLGRVILRQGVHLCTVCRWPRISGLYRPSTGPAKEFCNCSLRSDRCAY